MVQNFPNKYQNKLISTEHCLSDIYQNIDLQKKFISNLQRDIKSKIKIRLGSYLEKLQMAYRSMRENSGIMEEN